MSEDRRPNPDDLLRGVQKLDQKEKRGKLKVFFGMCPGVGKTFAMLRAAREMKSNGADIVIGLVETHGRLETEKMIEGQEIIPQTNLNYRGTVIRQLDVDGILARQPQIVLIDELAHTNAPGARHLKRYQDIEEVLNAGINVYTTLNVQHIESRADLVQKITGIQVQETVPDVFLENADQFEVVDISPEELLKRLKEGKVYLGDRAERAAQNFFKVENITALRELALRFTAEKVDDDLRTHMTMKKIMGPWNTNERLLVAISHSPYSSRLIRTARRKAYNLEAPWVALHVDNGEKLLKKDYEMLQKNIALAKELGAEVITTRDQSVSDAIKRVSEEKNVTQIILGRPDRRLFQDIFTGGNILDRLVRETSEIDVHVLRQERKPIYQGFHFKMPELMSNFQHYWFTLWFMIGVGFISYTILSMIGYRAVGFIFLLAVLIVASLASRGPILFAATFSFLAWNYFFIPPQFTFAISATEDVMMILAFYGVATVAGFLARKIRRQEADLTQREFRANTLYDFGKNISEAKSQKEIAKVAKHSLERLFESEVEILLEKEDGSLNSLTMSNKAISDKDFAVASWSFDNKKTAGWKTDTLTSSNCLCIPLMGRERVAGVLMLYPNKKQTFSLEQQNLLDSFCGHLAVALEREQFKGKAQKAKVLEESEKLHQALINSVSHELRTPLTSIIGAATGLADDNVIEDKNRKSILLKDLFQSIERLNRVIDNLLDMSRISCGVLTPKMELFEVNDFLKSTIHHADKLLAQHKIKYIGSDDVYILGDDKLIEHVILNLINNACRYSDAGSEVQIVCLKKGLEVWIQVIDEGTGVPSQYHQQIFERFFRLPNSATGGTGLGLSIVKAIVEAHGGSISVSDRQGTKGSIFTIKGLHSQEIPFHISNGGVS
ncbi:MAG: sensor histidine kinase KdpD [Bdellovibrionota bacterium]